MFKNNVGMAGILKRAQTKIKIMGSKAQRLTSVWAFKMATVVLILVNGISRDVCPIIAYSTNEPTKAGTVVHIKFLMWAKRSVSVTAAVKLVD